VFSKAFMMMVSRLGTSQPCEPIPASRVCVDSSEESAEGGDVQSAGSNERQQRRATRMWNIHIQPGWHPLRSKLELCECQVRCIIRS